MGDTCREGAQTIGSARAAEKTGTVAHYRTLCAIADARHTALQGEKAMYGIRRRLESAMKRKTDCATIQRSTGIEIQNTGSLKGALGSIWKSVVE